MPVLDRWLELAPKAWDLSPGQEHHVFLSYRSSHRPWVTQLYDALRHLGYKIFFDQYVLSANDNLVLRLDEGLRKSASGVLIWSQAAADSEWCKREYATMVTREAQGKGFHFVVAKLDHGDVPEIAGLKLYQDFSDQREGPCGSGLLKLIAGLRDLPLDDAANRLSLDVDQQTRDALAAIRAAQTIGDAAVLVALARSEHLAWTSSALLGCHVAEALIALGKPTEALAVLTPLEQAFPRSIRPKQLKGLALRRNKDWRGAQAVLAQLTAAGEMDPETMGIFAATWMDRYKAEGNVMHLRRSRDLYAQAFANAPKDAYVGVNAASKSALLGDTAASADFAAKVETLVGTTAKLGNYWDTATIAEVQLLKQDYQRAADLYEVAVVMDSEAHGSHRSTWEQAQALMDRLNTPAEQRALVAKAFAHVQ